MTDEQENKNQEGMVLGKVIRHVAESLEAEIDSSDEEVFIALLNDLARGFEETAGIEFSADQAQGLANAFSILEAAVKALSLEANQGGHHNAAAKLEWAALTINGFTSALQECHLAERGGTLTV